MSNNGHLSSRTPLKIPVAVPDKKYPNMWKIQFDEGGNVHESLKGLFNRKSAKKAIDDWVKGTTRKKIYPVAPQNDIPQRKSKKDGEEESISRV